MRLLPNSFEKTLTFREVFSSVRTLQDNGANITGLPTISNGYLSTIATSQPAVFNNHRTLFNNYAVATVYIDFYVASIGTATQFYPFCKYTNTPSAEAQFLPIIYHNTGVLATYIGGGTSNYASFTLPATSGFYRYFFVYDGSLAAANRLKIYRVNTDGTLTQESLSITGTIPTTMGTLAMRPGVMGYDANGTPTGVGQVGDKVNKVYVFKKAFTALEMVDWLRGETYTEFDASRCGVFLPLKATYLKENGVSLGTDTDMESANTAAWTTFQSVLTKETASPHSGTRYLRIAYDGSHAVGGAQQSVLTSGKTYRVNGWFRGDGTSIPAFEDLAGKGLVTGTSSTSWQYFDVEFTASSATIYLAGSSLSAGHYVEFDDLNIQVMETRTRNLGPKDGYALLGDGTTASTFPAIKNTGGAIFDGGDYITTQQLYTNYQQTFTIGGIFRLPTNATNQTLIANFDGTNGVLLRATSANLWFQIYKDGSNYIGRYVASGIKAGVYHTIIATYDGSATEAGLNIYIDGQLGTMTSNSAGSFGSFSNAYNLTIGRRGSGTEFIGAGSYAGQTFYVEHELTYLQASAMDKYLRQNLLKV